ncbi:MAG: hypothetical protein AAF384_19455 [Pseudomonadota bacterium]
MTAHDHLVIAAKDVESFFSEQLAAATKHQSVDIDQRTFAYLIEMLTRFNDPRKLFDQTENGPDLKPLAMHYADAIGASNPSDRNAALRRLGDIALFVAGIFSNSLNRKVMDVDYYIAMGGAAYGSLHDSFQTRSGTGAGLGRLFGELAKKFPLLVDVLGEIADMSSLNSNRDLLRDYEIWVRTGSDRALSKLRRAGLEPAIANISHQHH